MAKKEKPKVKLPKASEVAIAKPLVEKVERAKKRLAKVRETGKGASEPVHRSAKKRVKRAQRKLRRALSYAVARAKPAAAGDAAPETPAT